MAEIKTIYKGESITLLFTFPALYDMARLATHKIFVGETEFAGEKDGQTVKLQLKSSDTDRMIGTHKVVLWMNDTTLGLRKPYCGELIVAKTQASGSTSSVSNISDIIIPIVISETAITIGDILYNYVKGDKGDPFTYSDFTPEQLEALKVKGDKFEFSDFTPEQIEALKVKGDNEFQTWLAQGNEGTYADYLAVLQRPAMEAAGALTQAVNAKLGEADTAIQNAETATTNAGNAASLANEKAGLADQKATLANDAATLANTKAGLANTAATNADNARLAIQGDLAAKASIESIFKTLNIGAAGQMTFKPTTQYFTYKLMVTDNVVINIDLSRMLSQTGNARCRLIIDMPIKKTVTFTKPINFGGTAPTFATAGQYIFEVIDMDGLNVPIIWQVASTLKTETTGVILYVDSTGANYSTAQITGEVATRTTTTWANPFKYLQNAINAASAGDIIFVKAGRYKPTHLATTPTTYVNGDCLNVNARFTLNKAVDIFGGFLGTETKTWQRITDSLGYMVNETILCGDVKDEAVIDTSIICGDRRTTVSKANSVLVIMLSSGTLRYINGFTFRYANGTVSGVGINTPDKSAVVLNCRFTDLTSSGTGTAWYYVYAYNNTAQNITGTAVYTLAGIYNINCRVFNATGNGFYNGTNINCLVGGINGVAVSAFLNGTNINCITFCNKSTHLSGYIHTGVLINLTSVNNMATASTIVNTVYIKNSVIINNTGTLFTNKNEAGVVIFRNNAYSGVNPSMSGGAGSDIDMNTCIPNLTLLQAKIAVPSFIGAPTTQEQNTEMLAFGNAISANLKPQSGSILKGAGIMATDVQTSDYNGQIRSLTTCTIGAIEAV